VPYVFLGAGGACLLTAVIAGAVAKNNASKVVDASKKNATYDPGWQSLGRTANTVAVVTAISGLVVGGTGLYLLWSSSSNPAAAAAGRGTRTALVPVVGPDYAGGTVLVGF
jgi:hypothetical protein